MTTSLDKSDLAPGHRSRDRARSARRRRRPRLGSGRPRRLLLAVGALAVILALAMGAWSVPSVRTVLLQSFTRIPAPYTELYFTSTPTIDGTTVTVPVTVEDHGTGAAHYQVRVELRTDQGKLVGTATAQLTPKDGTAVPVVLHLRSSAAAALLQVTLPGHPQSLHYRIAGSNLPTTGSKR
jgi:hypothetical protein